MQASNAIVSNTKPETFMLSQEQQDHLPFEAKQALEQVDDLKYFLATAPANWQVDQLIRRYLLPTGEYVSCVLWRNLFHITGTDIVRALTYRFQAFGRPVKNVKKFEEGIFSDLRNLKPGTDASLEEPKSPFLDLLYKNNCIRTQKKQKVFYWFSVPHDRLFLDALERDLKRERMGLEATTVAVAEPALSFVFDATQSLYEQLTRTLQHNAASEVGASFVAQQAQQGMMAAHLHRRSQSAHDAHPDHSRQPSLSSFSHPASMHNSAVAALDQQQQPQQQPPQLHDPTWDDYGWGSASATAAAAAAAAAAALPPAAASSRPSSAHAAVPYNIQLFEGSPTYKQRRRRQSIPTSLLIEQTIDRDAHRGGGGDDDDGDDIDPHSQRHHQHHHHASAQQQQQQQGQHPQQPLHHHQQQHHGGDHHHHHHQQPAGHHHQDAFHDGRYDFDGTSPGAWRSISYGAQDDLQQAREHAAAAGGGGGGGQMYYAGPEMQPPQATMHGLAVGGMGVGVGHGGNNGMHGSAGAGASIPRSRTRTGSPSMPGGLQLGFGVGGGGIGAGIDPRETASASPYPARSYTCPLEDCGRVFRRMEHLRRHVKTHTLDRPFACDACDRRFNRSDNLAQHRRTHHDSTAQDVTEEEDDEAAASAAAAAGIGGTGASAGAGAGGSAGSAKVDALKLEQKADAALAEMPDADADHADDADHHNVGGDGGEDADIGDAVADADADEDLQAREVPILEDLSERSAYKLQGNGEPLTESTTPRSAAFGASAGADGSGSAPGSGGGANAGSNANANGHAVSLPPTRGHGHAHGHAHAAGHHKSLVSPSHELMSGYGWMSV